MPVFGDERQRGRRPSPERRARRRRAAPTATRRCRLAWIESGDSAEQRAACGATPPIQLEPPCYFNTGCCSFGDGDVTGLEIGDGEIRLIRWPCEPRTDPEPPLASLPLARVAELSR